MIFTSEETPLVEDEEVCPAVLESIHLSLVSGADESAFLQHQDEDGNNWGISKRNITLVVSRSVTFDEELDEFIYSKPSRTRVSDRVASPGMDSIL